ncbi:MAG: hypothetical protein O2819_06970 [Planctomycetota bacterium]|nr:hypothetical protein [Planctomycetota bacterium]MDA1105197.1 hypothetical protein [Planctomycetota bacterium]
MTDHNHSPTIPDPTPRSVEAFIARVGEVVRERSAPESVLAHAIALSRSLPQPLSWLDRATAMVATLVRQDAFPAVALSRSGATPRHLAFAAGAVNVELEVDPISDVQCEIHGQVGGVHLGGGAVALLRPESFIPVVCGAMDDRGYFRMMVAPGDYEIAIQLPSTTVLLPVCHVP